MRSILTIEQLFITILLFCVSCTKEEIHVVGIKGTLTGSITAYGYIADHSGITITVEGSDPEVVATTDNLGKFIISNLTTGTYDIIISKEGYCTHKILGYTFVGGSHPSRLHSGIYPIPGIKIEDISVAAYFYNDAYLESTIYFEAEENPYTNYKAFRCYLGNNNAVDFSNYLQTAVIDGYFNAGSASFQLKIDTGLFPPGSDLFMIVYPCADPYLSYPDINTGKLIYSTVGPEPSAIKTVKVPLGG